MADIDWQYIDNQFDNSTKKSYKRAKQQGQYHKDAIENAPPGIKAVLLGRMAVAFTPYAATYDLWKQKQGLCKGATQAFEAGLALLSSTQVEEMETAFKGAYKGGTPEHTSAFPLGREPFQQGGQDARIEAVGNFEARCAQLLPPLAVALADLISSSAPQQEIDAMQLRVLSLTAAHSQAVAVKASLEELRLSQNDLESEVEVSRTAVNPLRVALCSALYANLGTLMAELSTLALRPQIAAYFNLNILRETGPDEEEPVPIPPGP